MATEMAIKSQDLFKSDLSVSFTGNAGPIGLEDKPVGKWFLGIAFKEKILVYEFLEIGSRETIRISAVNRAVEILLEIIRNYY